MEVFYLKINRSTPTMWHYLKMWLEIAEQFPAFKIYIVCDNPDLQALVTNRIRQDVSDYDVEFITSARNSEELKYIVDNAIIPHWKPAAYAHLTTFLHARDNGYKNFWNIDADDIGLYAKPRKIAKMMKTIKDYATLTSTDILSLDLWHTSELGKHWSFGMVYIDNETDWLELMKYHCKDKDFFNKYDKVNSGRNIDWYFTYLREIEAACIETFCVENLRVLHDDRFIYQRPIFCGLRYCENGRCYFHVPSTAFNMEEKGSLKIPDDIINFNVGITKTESTTYLKNKNVDRFMKVIEKVNGIYDTEITVILHLDTENSNVRLVLESLSEQTIHDTRVVVTDTGFNETALKICREMESKFEGRMKIITGLSKENLLSAGLQAAKGRYLMFINGNEYFLPETFKFLHEVIENYRADVVHTSNYFVPKGNTAIVKTDEIGWNDNTSFKNLRRVNEKIVAWANSMISPSIFNKLIRREFLEEEKIDLPFTDVITQWIFSLQCLMLAENYVRVPQPVYFRTSTPTPPNVIKDFPTRIKSLAKCYEALEKLDEEVFYFDEYADEKNLIKNIFNKNFVNEVQT